jgi:hypothetical protein
VVCHAYDGGCTTDLPLEDFLAEDALLADTHDGRPMTAEHGGPVRGVVPRLYAWKSAKWIKADTHDGRPMTADTHDGNLPVVIVVWLGPAHAVGVRVVPAPGGSNSRPCPIAGVHFPRAYREDVLGAAEAHQADGLAVPVRVGLEGLHDPRVGHDVLAEGDEVDRAQGEPGLPQPGHAALRRVQPFRSAAPQPSGGDWSGAFR